MAVLDASPQSNSAGRTVPYQAGRLEFLKYMAMLTRDRVVTMREIRKNFGCFTISTAPAPLPPMMTVVSGEDFNREIFSQPKIWKTYKIDRNHKAGHASERLTRGLIRLQPGPRHKHYRKIITPALSRATIKQATGQMLRTAAAEIDHWPTGEKVNVWDNVCQLMQTMGIATLFGNERSHGCPMAETLNEVSQEMLSFRSLLCPIDIPGTPYNRMLRRAEKLEHDIIDWVGATKKGKPDTRHLLSVLVNSADEKGQPRDLHSIIGHLPTLIGGAFESSQSSVFWTLLQLSQHPDVVAKLVEEIKDFDIHAPDAAEALDRLKLLEGVVKEGMRLLPAAPIQARISREPTSLGGFSVPKRTYAFLLPYCTNREPEVYTDPDAFRPERWDSIRPNQYQYLTFSAGPRRCSGFWYGMASVKVGLLSILKKYRIDFTSQIPIDHAHSIVMFPRRGAMAILRPQDQSRDVSEIRGTICRIMPMADAR